MINVGKLFLLSTLGVVAGFAADNAIAISSFRTDAPISREIITNESVVTLANAGFSDAFIVEKILTSNRTRFDTSAEGLAYLRMNAIPEDLVQFIVEHAGRPLFASPEPPAVAPVLFTELKGKKRAVVQIAVPATVTTPVAPVAAPVSVSVAQVAAPAAVVSAAPAAVVSPVSPMVSTTAVVPAVAPIPVLVRPHYYSSAYGLSPAGILPGTYVNYSSAAYAWYPYSVSAPMPVAVGTSQFVVAPTGYWLTAGR
jgi:hypothetical protein